MMLTATSFDRAVDMVFLSHPHASPAASGDSLDHLLAICWITSDVAVDIFGRFFWAALWLAWLVALFSH